MAKNYQRRAGFTNGGTNMNQLMKQAQKMQQDLQEAQAKAAELIGSSSVGGGVVQMKVNAEHQIVELTIKPEIVDPDDIEMLQDMVIAAVNEAMRDLDQQTEECMSQVSGLNNPALGGLGGMLGL